MSICIWSLSLNKWIHVVPSYFVHLQIDKIFVNFTYLKQYILKYAYFSVYNMINNNERVLNM